MLGPRPGGPSEPLLRAKRTVNKSEMLASVITVNITWFIKSRLYTNPKKLGHHRISKSPLQKIDAQNTP